MAEQNHIIELSNQFPIVIQRADDSDKRSRGLLLGKISEKYILITAEDGSNFNRDDRIIVRSVQSGKALGFETIIQVVVEDPITMYFVTIPANIEVISLRKADRLDVFIPADVSFSPKSGGGSDMLMMKGNLLDISGGGCRLFTKRSITSETEVTLNFSLPGERQMRVITGMVLNAYVQNTVFGQRIRFNPTDKNMDDLAEIRRWVNQNQVFADLS